MGARFTAGMAGFLGAGIFRATRTRRWGVLIDESASMDIHNRIGSARYTACVIYRFCQRLGIPVLILGHSTGIGEKKKRVLSCIPMQNLTHGIKRTVFALRESVPDGTIETGLPLAYAGMRLGKRAEGQKLLFVISDGLPLAEGVSGGSRDSGYQTGKRKSWSTEESM